MFSFFMQGGTFMWLLLIIVCVILFLTVKYFIRIFIRKEYNESQFGQGINSILFWGVMSALVGFLGHYLGIYEAMNAIAQASNISPNILAGGYRISLTTILSGMTILILSSIVWFVFKSKLKNANT